jgi:hypothetical protein
LLARCVESLPTLAERKAAFERYLAASGTLFNGTLVRNKVTKELGSVSGSSFYDRVHMVDIFLCTKNGYTQVGRE